MALPRYAQRFGRLPEVLETLAAHPDGLPLGVLAEQVGVPEHELHEDLLAFYTADLGGALMGLSRPEVLEFLGPDGADAEPRDAAVVRIVDERPTEELGVEYVDARELALIYTSAQALLEVDGDDADLRSALAVLTETLFGDAEAPAPSAPPASWVRPAASLQDAVDDHLRVRIVYSRSWYAGVAERVIEPYRLVQTRRGWEVDAGPPDEEGRLRTYLVSNIREHEVLDSRFTPPDDLADRLAAQRRTTRVRVRLPHAARWAADFYAEDVAAVADDELAATLDLDLLPPLEHRLGLLLLVAGPDSAVLDPAPLVVVAPRVAAELLAHHRA